MCQAVTKFLLMQTWLVLIVLADYTAQVFLANSKLFSLASAILNLHVVWMASELAK